MNQMLAKKIIDIFRENGLLDISLCPGARNAPFVKLLAKESRVFWWSEERAAAFFALGRSRRENSPAAVITTSGTAAGELLPAAMEAYYTKSPLVLVTCDRPRSVRHTGAPQTCVQPGIFGIYVEKSYDIANLVELNSIQWHSQGPVHWNICFEEPL